VNAPLGMHWQGCQMEPRDKGQFIKQKSPHLKLIRNFFLSKNISFRQQEKYEFQ
jgi:hypothetical protein